MFAYISVITRLANDAFLVLFSATWQSQKLFTSEYLFHEFLISIRYRAELKAALKTRDGFRIDISLVLL